MKEINWLGILTTAIVASEASALAFMVLRFMMI